MKKLFLSLLYLFAVCILSFMFVRYIGQLVIVNGNSMNPAYHHGDALVMDKLSYRFSDPKRFDVIVFNAPEKKEFLIKRIIGLPGDTVQILSGIIYVNGEPLHDIYGITDKTEPAGLAEAPVLLEDDEYFCLGDNRPESLDSRFEEVGRVHKKYIQGKVRWKLGISIARLSRYFPSL